MLSLIIRCGKITNLIVMNRTGLVAPCFAAVTIARILLGKMVHTEYFQTILIIQIIIYQYVPLICLGNAIIFY